MAFTEEIRFSDLTKLLEALTSTKAMKKREEYLRDYFEKLHNYRNEFRRKNPDKVSFNLKVFW